MGELFGTDGVRGIPGKYPLVPGMVRRLGYMAARVLRGRGEPPVRNGKAPFLLMGRDSRGSGVSLGKSLAGGFMKAGCQALDVGILPTPAMSHLVPRRGALGGVMISASHNPAEFNGIKFFARDGFKMPPELEEEIERSLPTAQDPGPTPARTPQDAAAEEDYLDILKSTFPAHLDLCGMSVVVDCAHGAAYRIAPRLFQSLGARVAAIGCSPDGSNINQGFGALDTAAMRRKVVELGFDCGVSLDGDADRAIFADHRGQVCDGDMVLAMAAEDLHLRGRLAGNKVVLTVMSNFGLVGFLRRRGIGVVEVPVGDRNVTEAIEREGLSLGGESSGHIIFRRFSPTGDGLLTALQVFAILAQSERRLHDFRARYRAYPQILTNVHIESRVPLESLPGLRRRIQECERRLHGEGRVFVRYSGTEPLLRILVEGPDRASLRKMSEEIVTAYRRET